MPDFLTHLLFGASIGLFKEKSIKTEPVLMILLGSIIIDVERPIVWLIELTGLPNPGLTACFHSILGALVLSYIAATFFENARLSSKRRFFLVFLGAISHLILDMTMYPWEELGIMLFYPYPIRFSFHIFWPDYVYYPIYGLIAFGLSLLSYKIYIWHKTPSSTS